MRQGMWAYRKEASTTFHSFFLDRAEFKSGGSLSCFCVGCHQTLPEGACVHFCAGQAFVRRVFFYLGTSKTIHQYVKHSERTRDACGRPYTGRPCPLQQLGRALWAALLGRCSSSSTSSEGQGKSQGSGQSQKPQPAEKSSSRAWTRKLGTTDAPAAYSRRGPTRRGRWLDSRHVHARQEFSCSQIRWDRGDTCGLDATIGACANHQGR